jgi:small subunit ribosomal protein S20
MKNLIKELRETKDPGQAGEAYKKVSSFLDRIALKGVIHKNTAANRKTRLAKLVQSLGAS